MVHISQFYPCSKVKLPCELLYICELGKYLKEDYAECISIDGVVLSKDLENSRYWDYLKIAIFNGWVENYGDIEVSERDILAISADKYRNVLFVTSQLQGNTKRGSSDVLSDIVLPKKYEVSFKECSDDFWLWEMAGFEGKKFTVNNIALNHNRSEMTFLSLVAMVAVRRQMTGAPSQLFLSIHNNLLLGRFALGYVMGLLEETEALSGWCWYTLDKSVPADVARQLSYFAWYLKGRDIGYFKEWSSGKKKYEYLRQLDVQAGDIVMLYDRSQTQQLDFVKTISSCHFAKVVSLNETEISLELINTTKPYYHAKVDFDNHTMAVKYMYGHKLPYNELNTTKRLESLSHMGVDYLLYDEGSFILPLDECDDIVRTVVSDGERSEALMLHQNDLIYWILKDYDYEFNEERFLAKYFSDVEPVRTRYLRGESCTDVARAEG